MDVQVGVINPYALGEMMAKKNIKWDSLPDPKKTLSEILDMKEEDIFEIKNPILNPNIKIDDHENVEVLSESKAKERLDNFLKDHSLHRPISRLTEELRLSEEIEEKIPEMFLSSAVSVSESSKPWKPSDKEWVDKGDYFEDVGEVTDPIQGALGDCYYIAALASVSWARPYVIVNMIRPSSWGDDNSPIHKVNFFSNGSKESVEVSENVPVAESSHNWIYARSADSNEIWPAVMEKAYAKWQTNNTTDYPNYPAISGGDPVASCAQLIQGEKTYKGNSNTNADKLWSFVRKNSLSRRTVNPMVAWTYSSQPSGTNYSSAQVVANHAYSVLGWDYYNDEKYIVLRNPWGTHHATLDTRTGTWYARQGSNWAPVSLNTNGVFSMKIDTFKKYFSGIGVAT